MLSLGYLWHGMMLGMDRQTYNFLRLHFFKAVALKSICQRNHFYSLTTDFPQSYLNSGGDVCCASHSIIYKKVAWCKFAIIPLVLNMLEVSSVMAYCIVHATVLESAGWCCNPSLGSTLLFIYFRLFVFILILKNK